MTRLALIVILIATVPAVVAEAHTRDKVFSTWTVDEAGVAATIRLPGNLLARFGSGRSGEVEQALAEHFRRTLQLSKGTGACTPLRPYRTRTTAAGAAVIEMSWNCPEPVTANVATEFVLRADSLFDRFPNYVHFVRLRLPGGRMDEAVLTYGKRLHRVTLDEETRPGKSLWIAVAARYTDLGVTHILAGTDHLAFILALMLAVSGLRAVILVITGFTFGHSLTLALAVTGTASPVPAVIEALIGFTVAITAAQAAGKVSGRGLAVISAMVPLSALALAALLFGSVLPLVSWAGLLLFTAAYMTLVQHTERGRWAVALAGTFGLVHGFGFAGVLQETGLPESRVVPALLGFNVGVEAGQIMVAALALGLAAFARRLLPAALRLWAAQGASAALCGLGTYWFVSRAFAG